MRRSGGGGGREERVTGSASTRESQCKFRAESVQGDAVSYKRKWPQFPRVCGGL